MINIHVSSKSSKLLYAEIENKVDGIKELNTVRTKNEIMSAAFSVASIKFIKNTNMLSRSVKKSFHHVYEWGQVGTESGRLFRIFKKQETGGNASIYYKFNNSSKKSPISNILSTPGSNGKSVTRSGVFKKKAEVMENGKEVSFITSRYIAFSPRSGGIVFVPPGRTIKIKNPGGEATSGSFEKHFRAWWAMNFNKIFNESGITKSLENNVSLALSKNNAGRNAARQAIQRTLTPYQTIGSVI
jgi:hypothetical protein